MTRMKYFLVLLIFLLTACTENEDIDITATSSLTETRIPSATHTLAPIPSTPTRTNTPTSTSTSGPSPTTAPPTPIPNTIYLVEYKGQAGIFVTSQYIVRNGRKLPIPSEYKGDLLPEHRNYHVTSNFLDFGNPQKLITITEDVFYLGDYAIDPKSRTLYLSLVIIRSDESMYNPLYRINLDTLESEVIWEKEIGDGPYKEYRGLALIKQMKGTFLELNIHPCFQCAPCPPFGVLIINTESKAERFLGAMGNVIINLDRNIVSYQSLKGVTQCEAYGECGCDLVPTGAIITENLP